MKSKTETMTYDAVNRLISYNGKAVSYDTDGNMLYGPLNGQMASFTYDCRNRLIRTETDSGEVTKYLYDAENNRIGIIKNAGTEQDRLCCRQHKRRTDTDPAEQDRGSSQIYRY